MAVKIINMHDLADELGAVGKVALEKQKQAVAHGILKGLPILVRNSPVDTGLYAQSWDFTVDEEKAVLGNFAPHAAIIEYGARKGFRPPIDILRAWAKRVLRDPSQPPDYSVEVRQLAFLTQRKIFNEGIKGKHILENTLPMIIEEIKRELLGNDYSS